jgi:hypothetical protein
MRSRRRVSEIEFAAACGADGGDEIFDAAGGVTRRKRNLGSDLSAADRVRVGEACDGSLDVRAWLN